MKKPHKMRADQLLFESKMASSREKARAMILSGVVFPMEFVSKKPDKD